MKWKKTSAAILGMAAMTAGVAVFGSSAFAGSNLCNASRVCIYDHADWVGLLGQRGGGQTNWVNVSAGADNITSSWENKTSSNGCWAYGASGTGTRRGMAAFSERNYVGSTDNDKLTSWRTGGGC